MSHPKPWNWQLPDWPKFSFDSSQLAPLEELFLRQSGVFAGAIRHIGQDEETQLTVDLITGEAFNTSEIEGEILNRDSLQSSIRRNFGLATDNRRIPPAEQGVAQMMVEIYRQFNAPLTQELLFHWHELLLNGRRDLKEIGRFRSGSQPMQVVSGPIHEPRVHFEAPPSARVAKEMQAFFRWYRNTGKGQPTQLPILTRAGIAHFYFVTIHPFEDGNGRLARAIAEKAISEGLGQPTLAALSQAINRGKKLYYSTLEQSNHSNDLTEWLAYFARTVLEAQALAQDLVDFVIEKTKYYARFRGQFNERQEKAIARMMREGPSGFKGGLSAENYIRLTGTSRATATRDLQNLVELGALSRSGVLKGTRYQLPFTATST